MDIKRGLLGLCVAFMLLNSSAFASELTFQFINPSFGGNPLNGSYLLQQASMQNKFKEDTTSWFKQQTVAERFTETFTNQLLYRMSYAILDQIFGPNNTLPDKPVTYTIGTFQIFFDPTGTNNVFTITDLTTGQSTTVEIPKFM